MSALLEVEPAIGDLWERADCREDTRGPNTFKLDVWKDIWMHGAHRGRAGALRPPDHDA